MLPSDIFNDYVANDPAFFLGSPPAGSLFPVDLAPRAWMRVVARDFICRFSQVLNV